MRIAFINQPATPASRPRGCDSVGIWTYQVARRLAPRCDVLFYGQQHVTAPRVEVAEGIEYRPVTARGDRLRRALRILDRWRLAPARRPVFASPLFHRGYAQAVTHDLQGRGCDIVHIHNYSQFVPLVRAAHPHAKIVLHMHCQWLSQLDSRMIARRLAHVDRVIGCSDFVTNCIRERFPQFADRCRTIYNGVDHERFCTAEKAPDDGNASNGDVSDANSPSGGTSSAPRRLLYVGRISPEKGLHVLFDAFAQVAAEIPHVQLDIVGPEAVVPIDFLVRISDDPRVSRLRTFYSGSYREQLIRRLDSRLAERVHFHGNLPQEELVEFYRRADVLINPSLSEAFGMSLAEAMAAGTPVIGARVGGMCDVVQPGQTGWLVEPDDPAALADAIGTALQATTADRAAMGRAGRQRVLERFSWEQVSQRLYDCYEELCV